MSERPRLELTPQDVYHDMLADYSEAMAKLRPWRPECNLTYEEQALMMATSEAISGIATGLATVISSVVEALKRSPQGEQLNSDTGTGTVEQQ